MAFIKEKNGIDDEANAAFKVSTNCLLTNLIAMSSMNGKKVRIIGRYNKREQRYPVYVYDTKDVVLIKPKNLKIVSSQTAETIHKRYRKIYWTQNAKLYSDGMVMANPLSKIHKDGIKSLEAVGWKRVVITSETTMVPLFALTTRKEVSKYVHYYHTSKSSELPFIRQLPHAITDILDNKKLLSLKLKSNGYSHLMPRTFEDIESFIKTHEQTPHLECIWYLKHSKGCRGRQIELVNDINSLKQHFQSNTRRMSDYILQKEIKPLLTRNGRKFAIRAHAVIYAKNVWFHRQCIVLPNAKCYDSTNIKDKSIHIQNIGKKLPTACLFDDAYCLSLKDVDSVYQQMQNITKKVFECIENEMDEFKRECMKNCIVGRYYHLFEFDFMIGQNEKVYLLEINAFPAIGNGTMTHVDKAIFTKLIKALVCVILDSIRTAKQIGSSFVLL